MTTHLFYSINQKWVNLSISHSQRDRITLECESHEDHGGHDSAVYYIRIKWDLKKLNDLIMRTQIPWQVCIQVSIFRNKVWLLNIFR